MAVLIVRHEVDTGLPAVSADDSRYIDALTRPESHGAVAWHVIAERRDVADTGALAGGGDCRIGGVTAMAFQVVARPVRLQRELIEFEHGFAHAQQIDRHAIAST